MHKDIMKEDQEHSNHFPIIVVFYWPYIRDEDYKGLNRTVTPTIYLTIQNIGCNSRKIWYRHHAYTIVTPIFTEQMECIILCAPRDQSHIR
jgi:hypothetical protein